MSDNLCTYWAIHSKAELSYPFACLRSLFTFPQSSFLLRCVLMLPSIFLLFSVLHPSSFMLYLLHTISFSLSCSPTLLLPLILFHHNSYFTLIMLSGLVCNSSACVVIQYVYSMCVFVCVFDNTHFVFFHVLFVCCLLDIFLWVWSIFNYLCTDVWRCTNLWLCVCMGLQYLSGLPLSFSICDFYCAIFRGRELGLHFIRSIWAFAFFGLCVYWCAFVCFCWVTICMDLLADLYSTQTSSFIISIKILI